ncbi:hypothetical protein BC835DRAFT_1342884 [Cytidiella melzeri]|nr:hypothetical protein BC835DRAFT_1342884 [Cytidiella melzeri]
MQRPDNNETNQKAASSGATKHTAHEPVFRVKQLRSIINVQYSDRALTDIKPPPGAGVYPIFGASALEDITQQWVWDDIKKTITNKASKLYAHPESISAGARVVQKPQAYEWDVKDDDEGHYTIGVNGEDLYWTLTDGSNYKYVTLQQLPTNQTGKWEFAG